MPDRRLVEEVAADLGTRPDLIEKDWHVVRAIGVIAQVDAAGMMPAFSGGTSLSKGWELIKRFSEDVDFKVGEPATSSASRARRERTAVLGPNLRSENSILQPSIRHENEPFSRHYCSRIAGVDVNFKISRIAYLETFTELLRGR